MAEYALPGIFVMGCLVYLMESYVIRCPEQAEWNIRADIRCQNTTTYFCLYNYITYSYEEGCTGPDWDRPGSKRVYARNFNRAPCRYTRYQPIKFVTDGNSDCIFRKSLCTNEGQTLFEAGTTKTDSTCRCDYKQGYAFVTVPRNKCSCRPSEEDCSCYLKKCQGIGYNLSADYECTKNGTKKTVCPLMSENPSEDPHIDMTPTGTLREDDSYATRGKWVVFIVVLGGLFGIIVSTGIAMYIMLRQRLARSRRLSTEQNHTAETERMDAYPVLNNIGQNASNDESAVEAHIESGRLDTVPPLDSTDQNATNDQSAVEAHIESGRMDAGLSLDTIDQNATNDQSAGNAESESMDTSRSLNTTDQKVTNDQSAGNAESKRMDTIEQNGSNHESDNEDQIGLGELDENQKSAAEELKDNIEKEGLGAAYIHFNEIIDSWKNEPVKLAVTGKSGVGKSSFINAIRNLKLGDPGFATASCAGNTTKVATVYKYPGNKKITLHDLPGFGTTEVPKNEYEKKMALHNYDYILIFVGNIEENDIEIAQKLKEMGKPFCFVRSKIDIDILNGKNDGEPETEVIKKIMFKSVDILKHSGIKEARFFVISNRSRRIGHFNELVSYIQRNLPKLKCDAVMFSLLGELTDDIIDSKYEMLKARIWKVSGASAGLAVTPVPGLDMYLNLALICKELLLYHNTFGFGQQIVKEFSKNDYLRKRLSDISVIKIEAASTAMQTFAILQLGNQLGILMAIEAALEYTCPIIRGVVSGLAAGKLTHNLLTRILDGCRNDAKVVYSHLMSVNAQY